MKFSDIFVHACRETVAIYCENHIKYTNTLCGKNARVLVF